MGTRCPIGVQPRRPRGRVFGDDGHQCLRRRAGRTRWSGELNTRSGYPSTSSLQGSEGFTASRASTCSAGPMTPRAWSRGSSVGICTARRSPRRVECDRPRGRVERRFVLDSIPSSRPPSTQLDPDLKKAKKKPAGLTGPAGSVGGRGTARQSPELMNGVRSEHVPVTAHFAHASPACQRTPDKAVGHFLLSGCPRDPIARNEPD